MDGGGSGGGGGELVGGVGGRCGLGRDGGSRRIPAFPRPTQARFPRVPSHTRAYVHLPFVLRIIHPADRRRDARTDGRTEQSSLSSAHQG